MRIRNVLLLTISIGLGNIAAARNADAVPDELQRLIYDIEMRAKGSGPGAEQARCSLPRLYALRRVLSNTEKDMRRALTAGREQLREFMKCPAMEAMSKIQKEEIGRFSNELDEVIAGRRRIESLPGFETPLRESVASAALRGFALQRGDLILVRNQGIWSRFLIDSSQTEKRFSHVEIVTAPFEVVSVGVDEKTGVGVVCASAVEGRTHGADEVAVYRYSGPDAEKVRERIAREAEKRLGTPFDPAFDLKTKDRLYCTEMVRDCVNEAAGREVIGTSRKGDFEYVAVDDCYRNEMVKVWDCCDAKPAEVNPVIEEKPVEKPQPSPVSVSPVSTTNAPVRRIIRFVPKNGGRR